MIRVLFALLLTWASPAHAADKPFLDIKPVTSPGGITAWLVEDHSLPVIALAAGFRGAGAVNDPDNKQGLAQLLSNTLDEGAGPYDSAAFQRLLDNNAISLSFSSGRDHFYANLKTQRDTKDTAFNLLKLALSEPRFDADAVARMVAANQDRIRSNMTDGDWIAARLLNDKMYAGDPYARNSGGTLSSLAAIKPDDLRAFHRAHLARDHLMIGVVGDITAQELAPLLDQVFGPLPAKAAIPAHDKIALQNLGQRFAYLKYMPQTVIRMALPAPARDDADYDAFAVMNHILGAGGFGSRLTDIIREQRGLTYGIYTDTLDQTRVSALMLGTSTANAQVPEMLGLVRDEITRMQQNGPTADELSTARSYLLGSMPMALTSTDRIAALLLTQQLDQRPIDDLDRYRDRIKALTPDDLKRVAAKWLDPDRALTIMVGQPPETVAAQPITTLPNVE